MQVTQKRKCRQCGEWTTLTAAEEQWKKLALPDRPHIQDIFPELTPGERGLIISGFCEKCFDRLFGEPEEAEEIPICACAESPVDFAHNYPECKRELDRLRAELASTKSEVERLRGLCADAYELSRTIQDFWDELCLRCPTVCIHIRISCLRRCAGSWGTSTQTEYCRSTHSERTGVQNPRLSIGR
jgi:hypothetical protein